MYIPMLPCIVLTAIVLLYISLSILTLAFIYSFTHVLALSTHMGPLFTAMPRTRYQGRPSEAASTKLVGSENDLEESLSRQVGQRLSTRLQKAVVVSCSLSNPPPLEGMDAEVVHSRGVALAEKRVYELLLEHYKEQVQQQQGQQSK
jgi:Proteasome assembly chaperone 4